MGKTKLINKTIPERYYNELKESGHTVPRDEKTGKILPFKVGGEYNISTSTKAPTLKARCTQNCPYHLILLKSFVYGVLMAEP